MITNELFLIYRFKIQYKIVNKIVNKIFYKKRSHKRKILKNDI